MSCASPYYEEAWYRSENRGSKFTDTEKVASEPESKRLQLPLNSSLKCEVRVACPFFMPDQRFESDWPFPQRLPLGAGWSGSCTAPGHEGAKPGAEELKTGCNLGYAKSCSRLPEERHADAVRFVLGEERDGVLRVLFACERNFLPATHGVLLFDPAKGSWPQQHDDARVQRMAECYVQTQMERRRGQSDRAAG
jgi:hypothetical protein